MYGPQKRYGSVDNRLFLLIYVSVVGLLQSTILESVGCIWFNRSEAKDREIVARK